MRYLHTAPSATLPLHLPKKIALRLFGAIDERDKFERFAYPLFSFGPAQTVGGAPVVEIFRRRQIVIERQQFGMTSSCRFAATGAPITSWPIRSAPCPPSIYPRHWDRAS